MLLGQKISKKGGLGVVIRDHLGMIRSAFSAGFVCNSSFFAEAIAIRAGLRHAAKQNFSHVLVELDCSSLITQINSECFDLDVSCIGFNILQLQKSFVSCSFSFIPRSSNSMANSLARSALSVESPNDCPLSSQWLQNLCLKDVTACNGSFFQ
ncbi:uncharacterized protein LOC122668488 [Telopea speciosissima]|uniref:uncharacterized protein LOC122668488 n=1 Tax=Telopea speciosissima TaxID=54955 RepID=UPI001CC61E05|nr:uncharacterized protein LOC122668488 [Telopea speciosissima]